AEGKDFKASDEDVDEVLNEFIEGQDEVKSKEDLFKMVEDQDMDKDDFLNDIRKQVLIDQLIAEEAGDIEPSDDEIKEFYEQMKEQQEQADSDEELDSLDELKGDIAEKLKSDKRNEAYQTLVEKLREDADVKNHFS